MKLTSFSLLMAVSAFVFTSCSNGDNNQATGGADSTSAPKENTATAQTADISGLAQEKADFTNVDPKTAASVNEVLAHYLHVKNALASDDGNEAASGAKAMVATIEKVDPAAMTPEQKTLYTDVADALKEHAEHTAANAGNIGHQREHFVLMSKDLYDLVKGFGTDRHLFVDHCPMADNNKGANWLSETREIKNPYMGKKMPKCGEVEKVITK